MSSKIKACLFFVLLILVMPFVILLFYTFPSQRLAIRRVTAKTFTKLFGFKVEEIGSPDPEARLLILNHRSFLDVIYFESVFAGDLCWIAKKELGDTPVLGHALKAPEMLLIDREDKRGFLSLIKEAKKRLEQGRTLAIFPEGTRSRESGFLPFKPGAKFLAEKFTLKVQPIVLVGTREVFDTKIPAIDSCRTARAIYLDAFIPEPKSDWFEALHKSMERRHADELADLNRSR